MARICRQTDQENQNAVGRGYAPDAWAPRPPHVGGVAPTYFNLLPGVDGIRWILAPAPVAGVVHSGHLPPVHWPENGPTRVHVDSTKGDWGIRMQQKQQIKKFILENFLFSDDESALGDQDSLIRGGIIDSTGIHELIFFLEDEFKLTIVPDEMIPANFDSIQTVDEFVRRKLAV